MYRGFIEKNGEVSYMKVKEKLKAYIVRLIQEESEELVKRQDFLEKNVRDLNAQMEGQEALAENVRNLNAQMEGQEALVENVRNLNAQMESQEALAENVRNLNAQMEVQEAIAENVRNLNAQMEVQEAIAENVRNLNAQMEVQEAIAENVQNLNAQMEVQEAIAENVRNLNAQMEVQEAIAENVRNLNAQIESQEKKQEALEKNVENLNAQIEWQESIAENVRNLNTQMDGYNGLIENVRNLNKMLEGYNKVIENLQNNNSIIENASSTIEMLKVKLIMLEKQREIHSENSIASENHSKVGNEKFILKEDIYTGIDYFDFENYFRGSIEFIKRSQEQYIKYFKHKKNVLDLGCGRGEFLELLSENYIVAKGVDIYEEFVEMCLMKGLNVICDDAIHYLSEQSKVDGIFAGQLIEHLTVNQLVELCELAYDKLEEGSYIIMETPNPTCLSIYSNAFYIDPSHNKPVHPLTVKYILEKSGFKDIEVIYTDTSKMPICIPLINGIENADKFNEVMHIISELLFGSQDYAVIAKKHNE